MYEVPAGLPDGPDEAWDACARRELEEETGHRAGTLEPLTEIFTTPGFTDEVIRLYVASELSIGESNLDADEFVEVLTFRFSEVLEMVRCGEIVDCKSVATILYAAQFVIGA
jgi:ADP-ribose pyrophosphatase